MHGGPDKAIYVYPAEHYPYWQEELGRDLPSGMFGENLTVEGVPLENETAIGDRFGIGSAELVVTQPRLPCFKLGIRFNDPAMVRRFVAAARTGYTFVSQPRDMWRPATRSIFSRGTPRASPFNSPQPVDALAGKLKRTELQHATSSIPGREIVQVLTEIPAGVESGWHQHPGEEVGYILAGTVEMMIQGRPTLTLHTGDPFLMPPDTPHNALDIGPETGQMLSTYIVEAGQPIATFT